MQIPADATPEYGPADLSRRRLLQLALCAAPVSMAGAAEVGATRRSPDPLPDDLLQLGARDAVEHVQRGDLKAEHYTARLIEQHRAQKQLNAIITLDEARVLSEARAIDQARARGEQLGPLAGLPFIVKDQLEIAGYPTTAGNPALRGYVSRRSAQVADIMMRAGAVMLAKANCQDMVGGSFILTAVTSSNPHFGFVRNPYDTARIPGGSSGGNGAAIAARIAPAGIGEDTGGSVRLPAAFNGIAGFRPSTYTLENALEGRSRKRYPDDGMVPPAGVLDTWGPMARTAADVAFLDSIISGERVPRVSIRGARIGIPRPDYWDSDIVEPGVAQVMRDALSRLRDAGAMLVEVDLQGLLNLNADNALGTAVRRRLPSRSLSDWLAENFPSVTVADIQRERSTYPGCFADVTWFRPTPELSFEEAKKLFSAAAAAHRDLFRRHDILALAFPTIPVTAPLINGNGDTPGQRILVKGRWVDELATILTNSVIAARLGAPALTLPAGLSAGLPVGFELEGLPGDDSRILGLGIAVEQVLGPLPPPYILQARRD
jgi:mandelamide amidase